MFLTLVGLTALGVGGVGASEAVAAFLDRKRDRHRHPQSAGRGGRLVFLIFFLQVMAIALGALILGAASARPRLSAGAFLWRRLPLPPELGIYPGPLLLAAGFGLLSAIAFAVPPLGRARDIPSASLFRETVSPGPRAGPAWAISWQRRCQAWASPA